MLATHDLKGARERLAAWWHGELADRVAWAIMARRAEPREPLPEVPAATDVVDAWTNPAIRLGNFERGFLTTDYLGEAIPYFDTQIGPGSLAVFLGATPRFDPGTVWYEPCIEDLATAPDLVLDRSNMLYRAHMGLISAGLDRSRGRYLVSTPDLIEGLDTLAALHGNTRVLYAMKDHPELVHKFLRQINERYFDAYDPIYELIKDESGGCCFSAFQAWAPGRYAKVQCDFSAMISPAQFREFVYPYLAEQCERLDYTMYHLDGRDCIRHLEHLLDIEPLNAIQWTPGAGAPDVDDPCWFDMYRAILKRKSLILIGVPIHRAREVVREIGARGLFMVSSAGSADEGLRALEEARAWA